MDFVGADHQVVLFGEGGEVAQFAFAPAAADRVVRVAEQEQAGGCGRRALQGGFVPLPAAVAALEFDLIKLSPRKTRRRQEGRVDRRRREHLAIDRATGDVEPRHQPRQPDDPLRFDRPVVLAFKVSEHRLRQRRPRPAIAEDAVLDAPPQCGQHRRRRGKIHVRHPQRQDVATGIPAPLDRVGTTPVRRRVEDAQTSRCWNSAVDR